MTTQTSSKKQNFCYLRIPENSLPYAETASKSWRSFIGMTEGTRLYHKQFYEIIEPKPRINITGISDKDVHVELDNISQSIVRRCNPKGDHNHGSDELFEWFVPLEQAYAILMECCQKVLEKKLKSYQSKVFQEQSLFFPRPYQEKFVLKFCASTDKYFLLAAKCRSGKTCCAYEAIKRKNYKNALVLSFYGSPIKGWINDGEKYNFNRIPVLADNIRNPTWDEQIKSHIKNGFNYAVVSTAQFFSDDKKNLNRLQKVVKSFDCIVLDECHFGGNSNSINKILNLYPDAKVLEISATPYKVFYRYSEDNIFIHSYADEQRAKNAGEEWAQSIPKMKLVTALFDCQSAYDVYPGYTADRIGNIFSLNAPLVEDATDFYDTTCVKEFIHFLFHRENRNRHQYLLYYSDHIVASLPSNLSCVLFARLLEKMNIGYVPLVINDGKTTPDDIIAHCKKYDKTICLTYKGNVCGVTNPYWDTVLFLHDYPSEEDWTQFAFRAGSVKDRDFFTVIDFSPNRAIHSLYNMFAETGDGEQTSEDIIKKMIDFIDMNAFHSAYKKWSQEEIIAAIAKSPENLEKIIHSLPIDVNLNDEDLIDGITKIISGISANASFLLSREEIQISDNSTNNKSNKVIEKSLTADPKKQNKEFLKKIENIKNSIINLVFISELDDCHIDNFTALLDSQYLQDILEINSENLKELVQDYKIFGPNSERVLNTKLAEVSLIIRKTLSNSQNGVDCDNMMFLIDRLFHAQQHRPIPNFMISEFYDSIAEQFSS